MNKIYTKQKINLTLFTNYFVSILYLIYYKLKHNPRESCLIICFNVNFNGVNFLNVFNYIKNRDIKYRNMQLQAYDYNLGQQ